MSERNQARVLGQLGLPSRLIPRKYLCFSFPPPYTPVPRMGLPRSKVCVLPSAPSTGSPTRTAGWGDRVSLRGS